MTIANAEPSLKDNHGEQVQVKTVDSDKDDVQMTDSEEATNAATKPTPHMHVVDPQDLLGSTFLLDEQDDRQRFRAKIVENVAG